MKNRLNRAQELTKTAYNKTADKYHAHFKDELVQKEYDRSLLDRFSALVGPHAYICDAGCGPSGHMGKYLSDKGHRVTGIDISQRCIDIATSFHPEIEFKVMDMMHTDFKDSTFKGILSFYSIIYTPKEHVNEIFAEFNRLLKPEGKLLVVVKKGKNEGFLDDDWYEGNRVYFTQFMEDEIKDLLIKNDFTPDFMDTRKPYPFEINIDRIYAIGTKINHPVN